MGAEVDDVTGALAGGVTGACVGGVTGAWPELLSSDIEALEETCGHEIPLRQSAIVMHVSIARNVFTVRNPWPGLNQISSDRTTIGFRINAFNIVGIYFH